MDAISITMSYLNLGWSMVDMSFLGQPGIIVYINALGQNISNVRFDISCIDPSSVNPPVFSTQIGTTVPIYGLVAGGTYMVSLTQSLSDGTGTQDTTNLTPAAPQSITLQDTITSEVSQNITFEVSSPQTVGSLSVAASSDSSLDVTISIVSGPATIGGSASGTLTNSGTVTLTGPGIVVLAANQAGDGTYSAATEVQQTFNVAPAGRYFYSTRGAGSTPNITCFTFLSHDSTFRINATGDLNIEPYLNHVAANPSQITAYCPSTGVSLSFSINGAPYNTGSGSWAFGTYLSSIPFGIDDVVHFYAADQPPNSVLFPPNQVITWNPELNHIAGTTYSLNGSSSSELAVSYASSNTSIATISGTTISFITSGSVIITASQAGNDVIYAAPEVQKTFVVTGSQLITWNPTLNQVVGTPYTVNASAPGGTVTYTSSNTSIATISGTTVSFIAPGSVAITASQSGDETYDPAADVPYTFTVAPPACFVAGTRILTPEGYKAVETLKERSLVSTADGRAVPAKLYRTHLASTTKDTAPYTIPAGTFGLKADLTVSPRHAFQMRKGLWMIPAAAAKLSSAVVQKTLGEPVVYYHIECPQYLQDNLVVDGTVVESYSAKQIKANPYTWSNSLKGFTRASSVGSKITAPQ